MSWLTNPGFTPLANSDASPLRPASSKRSSAPHQRPVIRFAVLTTLTPASRNRQIVSVCSGIGVGAHDRVVADDVGRQREELVDVVGRGDAERLGADELADVLAHLLGAPRVRAHELHVRVVDDRPPGEAGDVAGGPQHDAIRHGGPFRENSLDKALD